MFSVTSSTFTEKLELRKRVSNDVITEDYIKCFDNDGFELSYLEQEYYRENGVKLTNALNHNCDQQDWFKCSDDRFKLDHSLILQRWCFVDEAKAQLENKKTAYPQLNKYLHIVPKWGLDFALEYYDGDEWMEVIHIENDYRNVAVALRAKEILQNKLISTDWNDFVRSLIRRKEEWQHLVGFAQNDWKAAHWGLDRAEITEKVFA